MKTFYVASYGKGDDKGIYIVSFNENTTDFNSRFSIISDCEE